MLKSTKQVCTFLQEVYDVSTREIKEREEWRRDSRNKSSPMHQAASLSRLILHGAWSEGASSDKVEQLEKVLSVPKGYFTEIEIVRLYRSRHVTTMKAVRYVRRTRTEEQTPKVVPMKKKLVAYHCTRRCQPGLGRDLQTIETLRYGFTTLRRVGA